MVAQIDYGRSGAFAILPDADNASALGSTTPNMGHRVRRTFWWFMAMR
jgi:hypothetical protein